MKRLLTLLSLAGIFSASVPVLSQIIEPEPEPPPTTIYLSPYATYGHQGPGVFRGNSVEGDTAVFVVPFLKFKLKDKVAIAIADALGNFSANELFQGYTALPSILSADHIGESETFTDPEFMVNGAVYMNINQAKLSVGFCYINLVHQSGPDFGQMGVTMRSEQIPTDDECQLTKTLNMADLNGAGGVPKRVYPFTIKAKINHTSVDAGDRAGDYEGSLTITMAVL